MCCRAVYRAVPSPRSLFPIPTLRAMAADLPPELAALLVASDPATRDAAWATFVSRHSGLLLSVARTVGKHYDAWMDGYAHVLEQLREGDFRRLRAYVPDGRTRFTTWLAVVARRLCFD